MTSCCGTTPLPSAYHAPPAAALSWMTGYVSPAMVTVPLYHPSKSMVPPPMRKNVAVMASSISHT